MIYPITTPYEKNSIQYWIKDTKNAIAIKHGITLQQIAVEYWYLANYYETTITYDPKVYEGFYLPRLDTMWQLVLKLREYQSSHSTEDIIELLDGALLTHFKAFNTGRENKYKINTEHSNIMLHMQMALLLAPSPDKLDSRVSSNSKSRSTSSKTGKASKTGKISKTKKEVVEYDF